jgi:hypothetical protein
MQRLGRAQFLLQFRQDELIDPKVILSRMFDAASIQNPQELFAKQPKPNPKLIIESGKLDLQHQKMQQDMAADAMKQQHEEASLQLRARHDAALIEKEQANALLARAQAVNQIAQAAKAAGSHDLGWAEHQLEIIKAQIDALGQADVAGTAAEQGPSTTTPGTPEAAAGAGGDQGGQPQGQPVPVPVPAAPGMVGMGAMPGGVGA